MSEEQAQYDLRMVTLSELKYRNELKLAYLEGYKAAEEILRRVYEELQKTITTINKTGV